MPVGYLVTVAFVGWCTLFALAPPRPRQSNPSNKSYWFGYLLNELPFLTFDLFGSLRFETVVDGIEAFAAWVRSRQQAQRTRLDRPEHAP
jgi:hypothetical protein